MSMIKRKTIEIGGARVTVRSADGWTDIDRRAVLRDLVEALGTLSADGKRYDLGSKLRDRVAVFAACVIQTETVEGDLGFAWPGEAATTSELIAAFACVSLLPPGAIEQWLEAIDSVDQSPGDPDLSPEVDETDPKPPAASSKSGKR